MIKKTITGIDETRGYRPGFTRRGFLGLSGAVVAAQLSVGVGETTSAENGPQPTPSGTVGYVSSTKRLTYQGAKRMAAVAVERAQAERVAISVAVVDEGGHLVVFERMDGGRFHTVYSATTKAVSAASNKRATTTQGAQGQPLDLGHALGLALAAGPEHWTAMEGGYPVIVDGECIGGIGVSGGDWESDARTARTAVEAIGAAWSL